MKRKGLITDEKEKPPLYIEDVVILQETVLCTMEKRFHIGLQRMQQCLYNLMACFTVNRISAMRKLQYKHLQCSIQRDPKGGGPRILLEITYKFAKKHLGVTIAHTTRPCTDSIRLCTLASCSLSRPVFGRFGFK